MKSHTAALEAMVKTFALPQGVCWYDCNGQKIFPVYAKDGSLSTQFMCFLVRQEGKFRYDPETLQLIERPKWSGAGIKVNLNDNKESIKTKFTEALGSMVEFDADGGSLPEPAGGK